MLWLLLTLGLAIAVWFATAPLLRAHGKVLDPDARTGLYQYQIEEINKEEKHGVISTSEADALRIEAQRRLLVAAKDTDQKETSVPLTHTTTALLIAGMVVAGGAGLYIAKGNPSVPSASPPTLAIQTPQSSGTARAAASTTSDVGSLDAMVDGLAARLESEPGDIEGWRMLGWSYFNMERYSDSATAYAKAATLDPGNADYQSARGEAIVMAAGGFVTDEALVVFDQTLALNAQDARARFFKGLSLDQSGDPTGAISAWIKMLNTAPADADWAADLRQRITARAAEANINISGKLAAAPEPTLSSPPRGPTLEQIQAAMEKPADDREAMIEGMVASLAAKLEDNPNDPEGWIRLIRSKTVLGRQEEAREHLKSAVDAFTNEPETRSRILAESEALGVRLQ